MTDNLDLELTLETGKTTIIIGANGSGKTRLAVHLEEQLGSMRCDSMCFFA